MPRDRRSRIAAGEGLTNIVRGGFSKTQERKRDAAVRRSAALLSRFKPYHLWVRTRARTEAEKESYRACFDSLVRSVLDPDFTATGIKVGNDGKAVLRW